MVGSKLRPADSGFYARCFNSFVVIVAILWQFPGHARANVVDFTIVQERSSIKYAIAYSGSTFVGTKTAVPQQIGSDTTSYFGNVYVDFQPAIHANTAGTIQFMPGSSIRAAIRGSYSPAEDNHHPIAGAQDANYGFAVADIGLRSAYRGIQLDFPNLPRNGPRDMFQSGSLDLFVLTGELLLYTSGDQAIASANLTRSSPLAGLPLALDTGSPAGGFGEWDGTKLTIPISSRVFLQFPELGFDETISANGRLVLTPRVPEPSSIALTALGCLILLSFKRRLPTPAAA